MNIPYLFGFFIALFVLLGFIRGWAKELLVTFAIVVALSLNFLLRRYAPVISTLPDTDVTLFWIRIIILLVMSYFGYETVTSIPRLRERAKLRSSRDRVFGSLMGLLNGYLFVGTGLFYYYQANLFYSLFMESNSIRLMIVQAMGYMPPYLLGEPIIYFTPILALIFVLIVYV